MIKLKVSLFILLQILVYVTCDVNDIGYSADDLRVCLDDCKDGKCTISKDPDQKTHCHNFGGEPKYYTTQYRQSTHKYCQSNCKYSKGYYWCYVDSDLNWDYCNAHLEVVMKTSQFTKNSYGPCRASDQCSYPGRDRMCFHYLTESHYTWDYCDNTWVTYILARDYEGKECRDNCVKRGNNKYYSCWNTQQSLETCAPPARFPTALRQLASDLKTISNKDDKCYDSSTKKRRSITKRSKGSIPNVPDVDMEVLAWTAAARVAISMVRHMATFLERSPEYETVDVEEPGNPVYRYTVVPSYIPGDPLLPLAIRARITQDTIREPGTRTGAAIPSEVRRNLDLMGMNRNRQDDNNDEAGHLIPWQNGGPSYPYNFVPQTRRLNRGTLNSQYLNSTSDWLRTENLINAWVRGGNGHVEQTIVVYYTDLDVSTRPIGFGTSFDLIDNNGAVRYQCYDNQFSNNPVEDGEIHENRIERTSSKRWRGTVRRIVSAAIYNLSCFTHGCSTGWVSGVLGNEALAGGAWLAALPCLVALPAAPFFAVLTDARGRKAGAFCICLSFILSWSLASWCGSRGVWAARAAAGAGGAGALALAPVYCAEIAPRTRGLAAMPALACSCGILFAYTAGGVLSAHALSVSMLVPPTVLLVSLLWLPETPSFLISIGRIQDAAKVMCWFDGSDFREDLTDVIEQQEVRIRTSECYGSQRRPGLCRQESETFQPMLKRSSGLESTSDKKTEPSICKELFRHRRSRRALVCICILLSVSAGSGAGAVTSFAASVLQHSAHATNMTPLNISNYRTSFYNGTSSRGLFQTSEAASMLCGTALVLGAAVATVTVDKVGRKMLLIWSCSGIACCLALLGAYCDPRLRMYSWSHTHQLWPYKYKSTLNSNTEATKHVGSNNTHDWPNGNVDKIDINGTKSWSRISVENVTKSLKSMDYNSISKTQIGQNFTQYHDKDEDTIWPPLILLSTVLFLYNIGLGSVPFVLMSELFSSNVRSLASSFLISFMWLSSFLLLRYFGTAVISLGLHGTYYICSSITFLGAWYTFLFIPETKGKSQKQIDEALEGPLLVVMRRRRKNREDP